MKKVKKMAFGGSSKPAPPVNQPFGGRTSGPTWQTVSKAANTPPSAPSKISPQAPDLKKVYERGPAISKGSVPPTPNGRLTGPFSGPAPVPVKTPPAGIDAMSKALKNIPAPTQPLTKVTDILLGRAPAASTNMVRTPTPQSPSINPTPMPVFTPADDLKEVYERGPAISKGSVPPTPSGRLTGPLGAVPAASTNMPGKPMTLPKGVVGDTFKGDSKPRPLSEVVKGLGIGAPMRGISRNDLKMAGMKKGGAVKSYAKGGKVSSASSRGDGIAQRGKTKGRMV